MAKVRTDDIVARCTGCGRTARVPLADMRAFQHATGTSDEEFATTIAGLRGCEHNGVLPVICGPCEAKLLPAGVM